MKKVLLVSPHFDDAILSAGQFMADRPDTEIVTVFGGFPITPENVKTPYDEKCGFKHALDAVSERRRENKAATALLNATAIDLDFPDSQYNNPFALEDIVNSLQYLIDNNWYEAIYAPIGLDHPDHVIVSEAVMRLNFPRNIYLWEDLPIRVLKPEEAVNRAGRLGLSFEVQPATTHEKMAKKARALSCYTSQIGTGVLDPYLLYVPERFWKFK